MFQKLLKLHHSSLVKLWCSYFWETACRSLGLTVWRAAQQYLFNRLASSHLTHSQVLPAWRIPSLRTSLNMPLSYRSADTTLSWRNRALRVLTAHCMASPPTRNKRCSACQTIRQVLYPRAVNRINWGTPTLSVKAASNLVARTAV